MSRLLVVALALLVLLPFAPSASAQNPHFESCLALTSAGVLTVSNHIAGLGNQTRPPVPLVMHVTGTAVCLNPVTTPPTVVDTEPINVTATLLPKNGQQKNAIVVDGDDLLTCVAPAEIVFVGILVSDTTHNITCVPPGPVPPPVVVE
jgi:hypothetical protein